MKLYRTIHKPRADGSTAAYHYHRITGRRISGDPAQPGFDAALAAAGQQAVTAGTIAALIAAYTTSPEWRRLSRSTVAIYERGLTHLDATDLALTPAALTGRRVRALRAGLDATPGIANQFVSSVSAMLTWAMRHEEWGLDANVCRAVPALPGGQWKRWPETDIARFEAAMAELPRDVRLGFALLLHTGQRRTDMLAMRWSDIDWTAYDGAGAVRVLQSKTGRGDETNMLRVPLHPRLRVLLEAERGASLALTIVHDAAGRPYHSPDQDRSLQAPFYERAALWQRKVLGRVHPLHGLRASAAARLAEAGCTPHEIMGITGHRSLAMVERYTRQVERHTGAKAAMAKLTGSLL